MHVKVYCWTSSRAEELKLGRTPAGGGGAWAGNSPTRWSVFSGLLGVHAKDRPTFQGGCDRVWRKSLQV